MAHHGKTNGARRRRKVGSKKRKAKAMVKARRT
jgi:hypothetical protein